LADEALGLQLVQDAGQLAGLFFVGHELALELLAGVISTAQQAQGPTLEGQAGAHAFKPTI
jgi:hypothetical protein